MGFSLGAPSTTSVGFSFDGLSLGWNKTNYPNGYYILDQYGSMVASGTPSSTSNTATSFSGTISGLSPNTSYNFIIYITYNDVDYNKGSAACTTASPPPIIPTMPTNVRSTINQTSYGLSVTITFNIGASASRTWIDMNDGGTEYDAYTAGSSFTFPLPYYNFTYYFWLISESSTGHLSSWTPQYSFTSGNPPVPEVPTAPGLSNRSEGALTVNWGSVLNADSYTLAYKPLWTGSSGSWATITVSSTSATIYGLQYAVIYEFKVSATNSNGTSSYSNVSQIITNPQTPVPVTGSVTKNSIGVKIPTISDNFTLFRVFLYNSAGTTISSKDTASLGGLVEFTGLTAGTTYKYNARTMYSHATYGDLWSGYSATATIKTVSRPEDFSGFSGVIAGADAIILASDWNDFCSKINEFRAYKGLPNASFSSVDKNQNMKAEIFNQAVRALEPLIGYFAAGNTIPPLQSWGDNVYASYFQQMKKALNSIT